MAGEVQKSSIKTAARKKGSQFGLIVKISPAGLSDQSSPTTHTASRVHGLAFKIRPRVEIPWFKSRGFRL